MQACIAGPQKDTAQNTARCGQQYRTAQNAQENQNQCRQKAQSAQQICPEQIAHVPAKDFEKAGRSLFAGFILAHTGAGCVVVGVKKTHVESTLLLMMGARRAPFLCFYL